MKLKNKKTGHIIECSIICSDENLSPRLIESNEGRPITLAELNEEWEDCNGYYYIGDGGDVNLSRTKYRLEHEDEAHEEIGNYFETEEEAELAVRKLKAWKRLKDKGFRFNGWNGTRIGSNISYISEVYYEGCADDMDLLFGGEE